MKHEDVKLKRKQLKSMEAEEDDCKGVAVLTFDGGSRSKLGTGGFTCWAPSGKLRAAVAMYWGDKCRTNNEAELMTMHRGLWWFLRMVVHDQDKTLGKQLLVLGDSALVIGFMNKQYRP